MDEYNDDLGDVGKPTNHNIDVMNSSEFMDWETPQEFVDSLPFKFDLDVCATRDNAKCERSISPVKDSLSAGVTWAPFTCWMNPPYGRGKNIEKWIEKAYRESLQGATVVCLIPNRTETWWFNMIWEEASLICFLGKRIKFQHPDANKMRNGAPFANVLAVFTKKQRDDLRTEAEALQALGTVIIPGYSNILLHLDKLGEGEENVS